MQEITTLKSRKIMKITEDDVDILPGCVMIETLNQERDVNKLMYIHEELALKGYLLDVWDYDYMGFFTAGLHSTTDANITNHREYKEEFIRDLVNCINEHLKE